MLSVNRLEARPEFGQLPPTPVQFTPVCPAAVVELEADVAFHQERWRQPTTLRRLRPDFASDDLGHRLEH
jgi:hypothetical protein